MERIELNKTERNMLYEMLGCCLQDLRVEIVHTENWEYKQNLRLKKDLIIKLMHKIHEVESQASVEIV